MKLTRRTIVLGAMTAPLAAPFAARAQNWPSGIIKIIVPFPPGGTADPIARMVQPGLAKAAQATLIIENKPGASGSVGTGLVAKSPPDGNTWLFCFDTHAVNPFLFNLTVRHGQGPRPGHVDRDRPECTGDAPVAAVQVVRRRGRRGQGKTGHASPTPRSAAAAAAI